MRAAFVLSFLFAACVVHETGGRVTQRAMVNGHTTCLPGDSCDYACPQGGCSLDCGNDSNCRLECSGGGCSMRCSSGATCTADCQGGGCAIACPTDASCSLDCPGNTCPWS